VGAWLSVRAAQDEKLPIEQVFKQYQQYLLNRPGVVSVGIGERYGNRFIQVYVRKLTDKVAAGIPDTFGGWKVRVQEIPAPSPKPRRPSPSPSPTVRDPDTVMVDVRGTITAITRSVEPRAGALGWIVVEGTADPDTSCAEACVAITESTQFYVLGEEGLRPAGAAFTDRDLRGETVEVEFLGGTTGADPVQATATVVVLVAGD